ncbi:hypothetical protein Cfor_02396 [Coptotermes formosanus]|uniref:AB hydrolase-1 domain-containing protein n=1 Tax=Coptotermes formosanus TaxID=36987 RepID=A0A6L2Q004_COPFO|nr:hypothetical protein Cfor_02396 [Coptotermes formosanus]
MTYAKGFAYPWSYAIALILNIFGMARPIIILKVPNFHAPAELRAHSTLYYVDCYGISSMKVWLLTLIEIEQSVLPVTTEKQCFGFQKEDLLEGRLKLMLCNRRAVAKKFLPNFNGCDASPRNYVMSLVPTFEDTGSALDNFKGVVGHKQAIRTDKTNIWRKRSQEAQGKLCAVSIGALHTEGDYTLTFLQVRKIHLESLHMGGFTNHQKDKSVKWPRIEHLRTPDKLGLPATRNYYITTDEGVTLGVWHVLPASLLNDSVNANDTFYEEALSHGEPVILYMHGNSGSRGSPHRVELYTLLRNMNYHVIAFDYRSYGDSSPVSPTEMGVVADGKYMFKWVQERTKTSPFYVWGHSLGTGVSSHALSLLAQEGKKADGLILESPFNNLRDELKEHPFSKLYNYLPWFEFFFVDPVGENQMLFETDKHLGIIKSPVLILHAEDDMVVPYQLGRRLYNTAIQIRPKDAGPIKFVTFEKRHKYGHKYICRSPDLPPAIL